MKIINLSSIANPISISVQNPSRSDYDRFIGLEHYDSGEPVITRFQGTELLTTSAKAFKANDILIARRNVYLKRAGIVFFDGITSGDSIILRLKEDTQKTIGYSREDLIRYIPFMLNSEHFWIYANKHADGMNSKRISKDTLLEYEFELPSIDEMRDISDKLWAAYRLKEAYKKLLVTTDEMVKSQFIEMFGNPVTNTKGWKTAKIKDVAPEMPSKEQLSGKIWLLNLDMIESNTGRIIEKVYEDVENALSVQSFDEGNVLFSKLRPYLNKVVIPDEPGMATTELVPLRPEPSKLHKVFLSHLLRGNQFVNYANDIAGGTKMPRMPLTELRNFDCILPPMDKQLEFVFIAEQVDKSKFGDFKSQFIEMFGNPLSLNQKNELKRLGECCILNPRRPNIALCDTDKVSFIPMPAVSEDGYLVDMTDEEYGKVKKSFTYFENNDVLFAKITPCMENGKGAIVHGLTNGIGMGSTEFHVLRPINGISSPYWLLALTRMPIFRERAAKNMSGTGGQKRVSASYLDHFMVGLPAIEEQRRFEAIYRQADKSKFGDFKSQFIEMYYNTHNKQTLESVCPIMSKGITPKYVESSSVLVINQACIHWDGQRLGNIKYHNEEIPVRKRILESGDVLLNATGNGTLGRCCVFICPSDNNTYINDGHVIALSTDRAVILPEVLNTYLSLNDTQAEIYRQYVTGSTNQVDIVFSDIKKMKVPVPSMDEQILFVEVLKQADKSKFELKQCIEHIDKVIKSLING